MANVERLNIIIGAKDKASKALNNIKGNILAIGAAYMGWRAATSVIQGIIDVGMNHEKVWNDVAASLKRHNYQVEQNIDSVKKFADEMQTLTGVSDEDYGVAVQMLLDYNNDLATSLDLVKVAADLSAGGHMDLKAAVDLVGKASVGYTGTLSRYGIIIDESIPKSKKFAAAIEQINQRFGGAAAARADTMAVKTGLLSERVGDLGEALFKIAAPTLITGVTAITDALNNVISVVEYFSGSDNDATINSIDGITQALEDMGAVVSNKNVVDGMEDIENGLTDIESAAQSAEQAVLYMQLANSGYYGDLSTLTGEQQKAAEALFDTSKYAIDYNADMGQVADVTGVAKTETEKLIDRLIELQNQQAGMTAGAEETGIMIPHIIDRDVVEEDMSILARGIQDYEDKYSQAVAVQMRWFDVLLTQREATTEQIIELRAREMIESGKMTAQQAAEWVRAEKRRAAISKSTSQEIANQMAAAASIGATAISNAMWGERGNLSAAFSAWAQDFITHFIKKALAALILNFVPGLSGIIGFDNPRNDRMAEQWGEHAGQYFMRGYTRSLQTASGTTAIMPSREPAPAVGGDTLNVHFHGPITDVGFVDRVIIPRIERLSGRKASSLAMRRQMKTEK